jgi:RHS repeat-associated protein
VGLYVADGHSGVRQVVDLAVVAAVLAAYRYDAFGNKVAQATAGTFSDVIGYRGERRDTVTGNIKLRLRDYDPRTGRFTAIDPLGETYFQVREVNRYGYAGSDPLANLDPSGQSFLVSVGTSLLGAGLRLQASTAAVTPYLFIVWKASAWLFLTHLTAAILQQAIWGQIHPVTRATVELSGLVLVAIPLLLDFLLTGSSLLQGSGSQLLRMGARRAEANIGTVPTRGAVAATGSGVRTLSGWTPKNGFVNSRRATDEVMKVSQEMGYTHPAHAYDQNVPGQFYASHAEKQLAVTRPGELIAVSKDMCESTGRGDCITWFRRFAQHRQQTQVVVDRHMIRVFWPDGTVTEIPK